MKKVGLVHEEGFTLSQIPVHSRLHWVRLVPIYMSCMACVPLIMVGVMIAQLFSFLQAIVIIGLTALIILVFDWMNAAVGADLGLPASVIARSSFGLTGSRFFISVLLILQGLGWYGIHIAVASRALMELLEALAPTLTGNGLVLFFITACIGFLFAFPNIVGRKFLTWTNYVSACALIILCIWGCILVLFNPGGVMEIRQVQAPKPDLATGVLWLLGSCASQFVLLSDYARFCRRITPDSFLFPLISIVPIAIALPLFGAFLVASMGPDVGLIEGFLKIGFPAWGLILVIIAQWNPARVVNIYSVGLALANLTGLTSIVARRWFAIITVVSGTALATAGILDHFGLFLEIQAFVYPAIGLLYVLDHFVFSKRLWQESSGVKWEGLISLGIGYSVGILVKHPYSFFLAAFVAGVCYSLIAYIEILLKKPRLALKQSYPSTATLTQRLRIQFCILTLTGMGVAGIGPLLAGSPLAEIMVSLGVVITGLSFWLFSRGIRVPILPFKD
ncbi:MAG: cytosine permease [Coprothermobacterota bacterium]|nr:cytosine permease [Coprothermobacterota bacterium]